MSARVLELRRRANGKTEVVGDPPDDHVFSARFIARELGQLAKVTVTVTTDAGDVDYELTGFEPIAEGEEELNFTAWRARRVNRGGRRRG